MGDERAVGWGVDLPQEAPPNPDVDARYTDWEANTAAELASMPADRAAYWEAQAALPADDPGRHPTADAGWSDQKADIAAELAGVPQQRSDFLDDPDSAPDPSTQTHNDVNAADRMMRYQQMDLDHRNRFTGDVPLDKWSPGGYPSDGEPPRPPDTGWTDQKEDIAAELERLPAERAEFWADPANQGDAGS